MCFIMRLYLIRRLETTRKYSETAIKESSVCSQQNCGEAIKLAQLVIGAVKNRDFDVRSKTIALQSVQIKISTQNQMKVIFIIKI